MHTGTGDRHGACIQAWELGRSQPPISRAAYNFTCQYFSRKRKTINERNFHLKLTLFVDIGHLRKMGKSQKKKAMRRHNPMRVPDSHLPKGLVSASQSSSRSNEILPIIQKMESADVTERKWACIAVSNLIQNDPSTRRLLQGKNVVGALVTRLTDSEEEVVVEAAGALRYVPILVSRFLDVYLLFRNLCIDGGYDICAEMYNKNILAPLKTFVPKVYDLIPFPSQDDS